MRLHRYQLDTLRLMLTHPQGPKTLVEGVDFEVDYRAGTIRFKRDELRDQMIEAEAALPPAPVKVVARAFQSTKNPRHVAQWKRERAGPFGRR